MVTDIDYHRRREQTRRLSAGRVVRQKLGKTPGSVRKKGLKEITF
jgi:hypothetical protein